MGLVRKSMQKSVALLEHSVDDRVKDVKALGAESGETPVSI